MDTLNSIYQPVHEELEAVKSLIKCHIMAMPEIRQYIEPYFNGRAKYMRPFLALMSAKMVSGGKIDSGAMDKLLDFAAVVELIHTASLVHDDIMDSEPSRRGSASLNIKYGPRSAVILGDMLYTRALQILNKSFGSQTKEALLDTVSKMCYGQLMEKAETASRKKNYMEMIKNKTGSLMGYSCTGIFHSCGNFTDKTIISRLFNFGVYAGMFYQMADDLIDKDADFTPKSRDLESVKLLALHELKNFQPGEHKTKLSGFLDFILEYKNHLACA